MPSRTDKPQPLSEEDLTRISAEIASGTKPTVWFTAAAVGVQQGRSGKIIGLADRTQGDFLHIQPTGSKDVLSFSPNEVTMIKPAPKRSDKPAAPTTPTAPTPPQPAASISAPTPTPLSDTGTEASQATTPSAGSGRSAPRSATGSARRPKAVEVTVTLNGTTEGEWTVDVTSGKKRTARGVPVSGAAVAAAAAALPAEVGAAVDSVLEAARDAQQAKVQRLQAELAEAQQLLQRLVPGE